MSVGVTVSSVAYLITLRGCEEFQRSESREPLPPVRSANPTLSWLKGFNVTVLVPFVGSLWRFTYLIRRDEILCAGRQRRAGKGAGAKRARGRLLCAAAGADCQHVAATKNDEPLAGMRRGEADALVEAATERRRELTENGQVLNRVVYDSMVFVPASTDRVPVAGCSSSRASRAATCGARCT